ncbi:MAG: tetratricopeptide repeat protein [Kiritimatiellia bacterium]
MKNTDRKNASRSLTSIVILLLAVTQTLAGEGKTKKEEGEIPDWKARWELARTLSYAKKLDESIAQYEKLLEERPEIGEAKAEMATVMFWKGKQEEALKILEEVPEKELTSEAQLARADIYASKGKYAMAEKLYREHLKDHPKADQVKLRLAETLSWAKKYAESVKEYEAILLNRPKDIQVRRKYALVLSWMGRHDRAAAELEKTLAEEHSK